jgi:hypothetical protein
MSEVITTETIAKAMDYGTYRTLVQDKIANNQSTGTNHSESTVGYTALNEKRMKRLDKTVKLLPETIAKLIAIKTPQIWLVLTEGWCGDAAQSMPVMAKMAAENPNIELKVLLRDENLDVIDEFLTNGGRSIPKLILLEKETQHVLASWGPQPMELRALFLEAKKSPDFDYPEFQKKIQLWYTKDKAISIQQEILGNL